MSKGKLIFAVLGLYLLSTGISYAAFRTFGPGSANLATPLTGEELEKRRLKVDTSGPKTEECPLNGKMFTKAEREIWEKSRPLGVMIENHQEARPQSGLTRADVIYEAVAEGGITRFLSIYYCGAAAEEITVGPIRSARTYYLDWISEYGQNPLYVHVGGANCNRETGSGCAGGAKADALGQIITYGWGQYNDLNQFSIPFPTFWRDYERLGHPVATEHTMYSTTDKSWLYAAEKRGLAATDEDGVSWDKGFIPWTFKDDSAASSPTAPTISYSFWDGYAAFDAKWDYDSASNSYKRTTGGAPHKDLNNEEQIMAKTVVVLSMRESRANDGYEGNLHLLYANKGTGEALVFMDGSAIKGTWSKKDRLSRTKFLDSKGKEISLNRGPVWISVIPTGSAVDY